MWAEVSTIVLDSLLLPLRLPFFDYAIVYHDRAAKVCENMIQFYVNCQLHQNHPTSRVYEWGGGADNKRDCSPQSILLHARLIWWRWCTVLEFGIEEAMWQAIISYALLSTTMLIFGAFNAETMRRVGWCDFPCNAAYSHKNESDALSWKN